ARADTTAAPRGGPVTVPMPIVDSTRVRVDSTTYTPSLADSMRKIAKIAQNPPSEPTKTQAPPDTLGLLVRADAERKRGILHVSELLEGRRPVWVETLPASAPRLGAPLLVDTGTPVVLEPSPITAERATDRTTIADFTHLGPATGFVLGVPGLAASSRIPETEGLDAFDVVAVDSSLAPGPFRSAGAMLARPQAVPYAALAMPDPPQPYRVRSALLYRKGSGNLLDTAARFSSPLFAHGIAGSYVRHASDELAPFQGTLSTRYDLAIGLTRGGALRSWVEGRLFKMRLEVENDTANGVFPADRERAEWSAREAALHALWTGGPFTATAMLRAGEANATQVGYAGQRERWEFPDLDAEAHVSVQGTGAWTGSIDLTGVRRRVSFRSDEASFDPLVRSGRAAAGIRNAGERAGIAADVAADFREGDATLFDGRLSAWGERGRARFRLDAESAHERPTFVDLLTPARLDTLGSFETTRLVLATGGNPDLRARALRGVLGEAAWRAGASELTAFGSLRRVAGDFGWITSRAVSGDTIFATDAARERGDGWVWLGAAGGRAVLGPLTARGLAWARGGTAGLSPQAGSPPKIGVDASLGLRASFFQGDLPLELELLAHAYGPRHGIVEAPGTATWDARLHTDFGSAGLFLMVTNLLDANVPSAVPRIDTGIAAPLPGRALTAGVVWYILD
ncbi:MAG: hypothetical protein ACM3PF_12550, partial [Bacteroidota bacterium]